MQSGTRNKTSRPGGRSESTSIGHLPTNHRQIRCHARNALGVTKPGRKFIDKQTWNENVQEAILAKKRSFKKWLATKPPDDYKSYKALKSAAKAAVAQAKMAHYDELYD